jgi:hypothetical protein
VRPRTKKKKLDRRRVRPPAPLPRLPPSGSSGTSTTSDHAQCCALHARAFAESEMRTASLGMEHERAFQEFVSLGTTAREGKRSITENCNMDTNLGSRIRPTRPRVATAAAGLPVVAMTALLTAAAAGALPLAATARAATAPLLLAAALVAGTASTRARCTGLWTESR